MKFNRIFNILVMGILAFSASATEFPFTYNTSQETVAGYGYGRPDKYDVCIKIQNPILSGAEIMGITVPLPDGGEISDDGSAWIAALLPDDDFSESNTLAFATLNISDSESEKILTASFPAPVILPDEGLYVGYTVSVSSLVNNSRKFPVATVAGSTEGSLIMRTTTHPKWDNAYTRLESMSPMTVTLNKDLPSPAAAPALPEKIICVVNKENSVKIPIINQGLSEISSIGFSYTANGKTIDSTRDFSPAIPALFEAKEEIVIDVKGAPEAGNSDFSFEIKSVNGVQNMSEAATSRSILRSIPQMPVNRPLMEEYSGLWCGQCPSGWVALEQGRDLYGSDFVAISYHIDDDMQADIRTPQPANAVPAIYINRGSIVGADQCLAKWKELSEQYTDCAIDISLYWDDASKSMLNAKVSSTFMENHPRAGYKLAVALIADGLRNSSWMQTNYFSGQTRQGKFWDIFTQGGGKVSGLTFNDIACIFAEPLGIEASLPADIVEFEQYEYTQKFNLKDAYSVTGFNLASNKEALRVVAIVLNSKGEVINSNSSALSKYAPIGSGVDAVDIEREITFIQYYTLDGIAVANPAAGIPLIKVSRYDDGAVICEKVILKE